MAVAIAPYCTSTFNNLPGFEVASPKFDVVIITHIMTPLFRKYNIEKVLGLPTYPLLNSCLIQAIPDLDAVDRC
jgi:hypothetical protein